LEDYLACPLLLREHRGVRPTEIGAAFLREIGEGFRRIDAAVCNLELDRRKSGPLRVRLFSTMMSDWLVPRLDDFRAMHPGVKLRLSGTSDSHGTLPDDIDIAAMREPEGWEDLHCVRLFYGVFTPVCAPSLLEAEPKLRHPGDLRHHTLFFSKPHIEIWNIWCALAGIGAVDTGVGMIFESSSHACQAARAGGGVSMAQLSFVLDDVKAGRLVAPFDLAVRSKRPYCLVSKQSRKNEPQLAAFRDWMSAEARRTEDEVRQVFATRFSAGFPEVEQA